MENSKFKKGIITGLFCAVFVGFEPIVANARPEILDAYFFAATTCLMQGFLFLPLALIERKRIKASLLTDPSKTEEKTRQLNGWKSNKLLLIYIGINFGIAQILFFLGYRLAGAINGSLAQKTTVIFALLFGYLINKEKITKMQVIFSFILLFGLILAITEGSFNLLQFNLGVIVLLITAALWYLAHALTKPVFDRKELTSILLVFLRNMLSGIFLFITYFLFFPIENIMLLFNPIHMLFIVAMGVVYGFALYFWYKSLADLGTSKASVIASPTPIITALLATMLLGEIFSIFHLIGMLIVIGAIVMIVRPQKKAKEKI